MIAPTLAGKLARQRPILDVAYGVDPAHKFDLYPAAASSPSKLVVFLHGGGFVTGNRRGGRLLSGHLNQAGYTLACVGYRLMPHTDLAGCVTDAANAIGYLLSHAAELNIEPDRCAIMGHSAGAHMAALLATDHTYLLAAGIASPCAAGIVALDGIYDLTSFLTGNERLLRREIYGHDQAAWEKYSPIRYVATTKGNPRFCLMHEDMNQRFVHQANVFETQLRRYRKTVVSAVAPGLKHAELMLSFKSVDQPMLSFALDNLAAIFDRSAAEQ